ncbi:TPA: hypothetical protein OC094_003944 [Escherichia coli]|nr:hypothetical protein [Escherichia coli]
MKINLLRGYLLSATQHGNKPPSRHEAESLNHGSLAAANRGVAEYELSE